MICSGDGNGIPLISKTKSKNEKVNENVIKV
jgi:hypothetical protein